MKEKIISYYNKYNKAKDVLQSYHIPAYASQASYFALLSVIPCIMLFIIVVGTVMPLSTSNIEMFVKDFIPQQMRPFAVRFLEEIFSRTNIPVASMATIFLIWAASKGIRGMGSGIQFIFDSEQEHSFIKSMTNSILYTITFIVMLALSLLILVFANPLQELISSMLGNRGTLILTVLNLRNIIFFFTLTFLFMLAYKSLAKSAMSFAHQFVGAAVAACGWIVYSFAYSIYITYFSKYTYLYGSLGAIMLLMLWLYMCMNIFLIGALINKLRYEKRIKK